MFGALVLGIALLAPLIWGYNVWLDVLAERRTIQVSHQISDGTENLPEFLTAQMILVAEAPGNAGLPCTVKLSWIESDSGRTRSRVIHTPDQIDSREVLLSDGIRESPHYNQWPVTFRTNGCRPWHVATSS